MSTLDLKLANLESKGVFFCSLLMFFASLILLSFNTEREQFIPLITYFILGFTVLLYWLNSSRLSNTKMIWMLSILARVTFLFSLPALSDDYFRFIWDGKLLMMGENPFSYLPDHFMSSEGLSAIYEQLNSKQYFSVYPPVMQACFSLGAWIGGEHVWLNVFVLKFILLITDLGVIYFAIKILKILKLKVQNVLIYALNPLVLVEVVGNLHFEAMMMFFTLWALYLIIKNPQSLKCFIWSALIFSLGVSTKLVSLLFIPVLLRWIGWKRFMVFGSIVSLSLILQFLPFVNEQVVANFSNSLDLYFRSFEFNASIYFISNFVYAQFMGWEEIKFVGPAIALTGVSLILFFSWQRKILTWERYFEVVLLVLTIHLLFSTTVHPWYLINLLVASIFTRFKYAVMWSFAIVITYFFYIELKIPWYFLALEYFLVLAFVYYELRKNKKKQLELTN